MYRSSLLAVFLLFLLVSCKPPESKSSSNQNINGPQIRIETDGEAKLGPTPIVIYLLENGEGVSGAKIEITGDMTHAGMVPVISRATEVEKGLYRADDFAFTMAGDWILSAEIELANGDKISSDKSLTVVK